MGEAFYITKGLGETLDIKASNRKKEMKIIAVSCTMEILTESAKIIRS